MGWRSLGILQQTRDVFFRSLAEELRPLEGQGLKIHASTGVVGTVASEWWGSSQSALSAAIWSKTRDVYVYGPGYNVPIHLLAGGGQPWPREAASEPVLLHYHFLAEPEHQELLLHGLHTIGCAPQAIAWVAARLPMFD